MESPTSIARVFDRALAADPAREALVTRSARLTYGELDALAPKKRGPEAAPAPDARDREVDELKRQLAKATIRAERAEALIDIQKKVAALLVTPLEDPRGK